MASTLNAIQHRSDIQTWTGWKQPADYISRHPYEIPRHDNAGEAYIAYIVENAIPKSLTLRKVMSAIGKDQQLQNVMQAIQTGHWIDPKIKDFSKFKDEFSIYDGLILRQNHIIMPATLCQKTIAIAHQAHQGIVKTKQCIREKVWFPRIDRFAGDTVKSCIPCQASHPGNNPCEPLQPTTTRTMEFPCLWFCWPFFLRWLLTCSHRCIQLVPWGRNNLIHLNKNSPAKTWSHFFTLRYPFVCQDRPWSSIQWGRIFQFYAWVWYKTQKIRPLWLKANEEVECLITTLNKNVRSCVAEGTHTWKSQLPTFLRMYRGTPHTFTKISPFEALTGKKLKVGLLILPSQTPTLNYPYDNIMKRFLPMTTSANRRCVSMLTKKGRPVPQHFNLENLF